jgi:hypothetical protein
MTEEQRKEFIKRFAYDTFLNDRARVKDLESFIDQLLKEEREGMLYAMEGMAPSPEVRKFLMDFKEAQRVLKPVRPQEEDR